MGRILVGTSGFAYPHWRRLLYPEELPQRLWLACYAAEFPTVELNSTFYRLPDREAVERWRRGTPADFVFAAKGSRFMTHMKRLLDPVAGLERYFEPVRGLGPKLAVVLWQLPPRWGVNLDRLEAFLAELPRRLARRPLRHAVEFRDESWYREAVCEVLDRHGAAFCEHDLVRRAPPRLTGGFCYLRFHGRTGRYRGRYGAAALAPWAADLRRWSRRGDAYVYLNNDVGGHAVEDARDLRRLLGDEARPRASTGR